MIRIRVFGLVAGMVGLTALGGVTAASAVAADCSKAKYSNTWYCGNKSYQLKKGLSGTYATDQWGRTTQCRTDFFTGKLVCR